MPTYSTAQFRQYVVDLLQQATGLTISIPTILSTAEYRGLVVDLLTVLAQGGGGGGGNATQLQGRNISATAPTNGQVLAWNGTVWIPTSATGSGTVTSVALSGGTTGLTTSGGPITGSGTITLAGTLGVANGGTGATTLTGYVKGNGTGAFTASATIAAADVSGALAATNLPALSGDLTSTAGSNSITVAKLRGQTVSATVPTSGQILKFDGTQWAPAADAGGISSITAGTGLSGGTITTSGTIAVNFGTTTGTVTQGGTTVLKAGDSMTGALSIGLNNNSDALTITQAGNGNAFVVGTNALIIDKTGHVGIGLTPNPSYALRVDTGGIFTQGGLTFGDSSVQTTAGVTSLTGDVTTVGAGASAATVAKIRGITVSATAPTSGQVLKYDGTQWAPAADTASNVTGTVAIANGGTGQTTANAALNALLPTQTGNNGKVLSTDGTNTSWTAVGGSGTVTSITAGTGLSGGTITTSGTIAVDFGTTAGTVAAGDDSRITGALQTSGGTMTGKLTAAASDTEAKLNVGSRLTTGAPSTIAAGDIWISNQGSLSYRDSTGPTSRAVASLSLKQTFNQPQTVAGTMNADPALTVSNTGTREVVTISNTAAATSDAVVITNLGSGNSLVVNDETTPDSTRFAVANNGRVGIGVAPDASVALSVDSTGIKFSNGSTQTVGGITALTSDVTASGSGSVASTVVALQGRAVASTAPTSGQVLAWNGTTWAPTTGGGGGGITALTGDVTASGTGSVTAVVARLRGIPLSLNAPINNQILQYNATVQEWQPSSSAAGAITMVAYTAVGYQSGVSLPAGYAWADIYVCSGAGGGGGGMDCMNGYNGGAAYGGGGGGAGLSEFLQKIPIDGATFEFEIGAGGAGGVGQSTYTGQIGTDGGDGMPTYLKMNRYGVNRTLSDLGKYAEPATLNSTGGQAGNLGGGAGYCTLSFPANWRSTLTQGGSGTYGVGNPSIYTGNNNVGRPISVGGSSGAGISTTPNDGGPITNIKFPNLDYSTNTLLQYQGKATSGAQDALPLPTLSLGDVDFNSLNFLGGAGGASADYYLNIPMPSPITGYRAGNGVDGQLGCGGGGGGAIGGPYSDASSPYYGGDGGDGGQGYIIFICYN